MNKSLSLAQRRVLNWLAMQAEYPTPTNGNKGWYESYANADPYNATVIPAMQATLDVLVVQGLIEEKRGDYSIRYYQLATEWTVDSQFRTRFTAQREMDARRNDGQAETRAAYSALWDRPKDLTFKPGQFVYIYVNHTTYMTEQLGLVVAFEQTDQFGSNIYAVQTSQGVYLYPARQMVLIDEMKAVVWRESEHGGEITDLVQEHLSTTLFMDDSPVAWYDDQDGHLVVCDIRYPELGFAYRTYFILWLMLGVAFAVNVTQVRS